MKNLIALLFVIMANIIPMHAQQGLHVNALFKGEIIPKEQMMETSVRGKMIAKYQLSFFHSLRFYANSDEQKVIEQLVAKDCEGKDSYEKATNNKIMKKISKVSTEMVKLDSQEGKNRYLCYKATTYKHKSEIVIIYMEGSLTSITQLKTILNNAAISK